MMNEERTRIADLLATPAFGQAYVVWGWIRTARRSAAVSFVHINDGSTVLDLQLVLDAAQEGLPEPRELGTGACVKATGVLVESQGRNQTMEIKVATLEVVGATDEEYPLQKKRHSFEFLRTLPSLRPRTRTFQAVFRMRSAISQAMHEVLGERGFQYVHPPLITRSDCEGAGQAFRVTALDSDALRREGDKLPDSADYFGRPTWLTVSGQLEGEAMALGLGEIYTFSPIFRADPSETARHAAEFWMVEPEMAFYDFEDLIVLIEAFIKGVASRVRERCAAEIDFLGRFVEPQLKERYDLLIDQPFARITYTDAITALQEAKVTFEHKPRWGEDLASEHESYLTEQLFGRPVFITDYPLGFKPFYMRQNDDGRTVACLDLLAPWAGELLTGSQREERYDLLLARAEELGLSLPDYEWYLATRRWGSAPHSGFGIGLERILMYLSGMKNIRDLLPFPRTRGSI